MSLPLPSTFMPLPLPMMIPFMGIQSAVMAMQFGQNFQFGKRKISAMSNEEFNELTFTKLMQQTNVEVKALIPTMEQSLADMRPFTEFIIREFGVMIQLLIGQTGNQFDKATQTAQDDFYHFMGWGHAPTSYHSDGSLHEGATETNPPPPEDPPIEEPPIEEPPIEEPPAEEPPTETNHATIKQWIITKTDPISLQNISWTSITGNLSQHKTIYATLSSDLSLYGGGLAWASKIHNEYSTRINAFYDGDGHV